MAARKPVLSPARICTYLECPRKYQFVYVHKLPCYFPSPRGGAPAGN